MLFCTGQPQQLLACLGSVDGEARGHAKHREGAGGGAHCHACAHVQRKLRKPLPLLCADSGLRRAEPAALPAAHREDAAGGAVRRGGRVYVHCTAGLGRAPAVCIAWRYWFGGDLQLDEVRGGPWGMSRCWFAKHAPAIRQSTVHGQSCLDFCRMQECSSSRACSFDRQPYLSKGLNPVPLNCA